MNTGFAGNYLKGAKSIALKFRFGYTPLVQKIKKSL